MKDNNSYPNSTLVEHPLASTVIPASQASNLRLLSADRADFVDTALRFLLILCLLASLVLCGFQSSHVDGHTGENATPLVPTSSQVVSHVPAMTGLSFCGLTR